MVLLPNSGVLLGLVFCFRKIKCCHLLVFSIFMLSRDPRLLTRVTFGMLHWAQGDG